jgi:hypothetical protein
MTFVKFWNQFVLEALAYDCHFSEMGLIWLGIIFLFLELVFEQWNALGESLDLVGLLIFSELGGHLVHRARLLLEVVHIDDLMCL